MSKKTVKPILFRPSAEERRVIDRLLQIAARQGYTCNDQDVIRKAIRRDLSQEEAKTEAVQP